VIKKLTAKKIKNYALASKINVKPKPQETTKKNQKTTKQINTFYPMTNQNIVQKPTTNSK
jgi:hypothetical protein